MTRKSPVFVLCFLAAAIALSVLVASACDLPAEPTAGAVPERNEQYQALGVTCINETRTSDPFPVFLLPEGGTLKIDCLWDPYDHGEGGEHSSSKYQGVVNAGVQTLPKFGAPSGYGFFPVEDMANYFNVSGNRNDQQEAVARAVGGFPSNSFLKCEDKPHLFLNQTFVRSAERQSDKTVALVILPDDHTAGRDGEAILFPYKGFPKTQMDVEPPLDSILPNPVSPAPDKTVIVTSGKKYKHTASIVPGSIGLYMGDLAIGIDDVDPREYRAYLHSTTPKVVINGIPEYPSIDGPHYNAEFPTPTAGSTKVKTKVDCPGVGFYVHNAYWAWEEKVQTWVASTTTSGEEWFTPPGIVRNTAPEVTTRRCSVGLSITCYKPGGGPGSIDYTVLDARPPITAKFQMGGSPFVCGDPMPDTDFTFTFVDTHPFGNVACSLGNVGGTPVYVQDPKKVTDDLAIFYSYPESNEDLKTPRIPLKALAQNEPLGMLAFAEPDGRTTSEFIGSYYTPKWVWKKAQILSASAETATFDVDDRPGYLGGMTWTVKGRMRMDVPAPKHLSNQESDADLSRQIYRAHGVEYPAAGIAQPSDLKKMLKVFAIVSDSVGHKSTYYDVLSHYADTNVDTPTARGTEEYVAEPQGTMVTTTYNQNPNIEDAILAATGQAPKANLYPWQKYQSFSVRDGTGTPGTPGIPTPGTGGLSSKPEIQVIIFDTRNNRCHLLGDRSPARDYRFVDYAPERWTDLFKMFFNDPAGGADLMGVSPKPSFVAQSNSRFLFYIRAWDNINTFNRPHQGIKTVKCTIDDFSGKPGDIDAAVKLFDGVHAYDYSEAMTNPLVWQFREPNCDDRGNGIAGKNCIVKVTATDFSGNSSDLQIDFHLIPDGVVENTIRTLEERHIRSN